MCVHIRGAEPLPDNIGNEVQKAVAYLSAGKIIAYPTEAVYGLGCDPFNKAAVLELISLKGRSLSKGLILIVSAWQQFENLIKPLSPERLEVIKKTWPGPITWAFPANPQAPSWLRGEHDSIAIRMTAHPLAQKLCDVYQKPIVSTSANLSGHLPAKTYQEVVQYFGQKVAFVLKGEVGDLANPTPIFEALTGKQLR